MKTEKLRAHACVFEYACALTAPRCECSLPASGFPPKGVQCIECDTANESLQRFLRKLWGAEYKKKWAELKKDKTHHRTAVREHRPLAP